MQDVWVTEGPELIPKIARIERRSCLTNWTASMGRSICCFLFFVHPWAGFGVVRCPKEDLKRVDNYAHK